MIKFENITPLDKFKEYIKWQNLKIREDQLLTVRPNIITGKRVWNITDRFNNEWNIVFNGRVDEWSIFNVCNKRTDIPFRVDIVSCGNKIEIHKAEENGRKLKADRYLKKFQEISMFANCLIQLGYLK